MNIREHIRGTKCVECGLVYLHAYFKPPPFHKGMVKERFIYHCMVNKKDLSNKTKVWTVYYQNVKNATVVGRYTQKTNSNKSGIANSGTKSKIL